jgi:pimeloyl-ACP methyl ester carboxylesterase
MTQHASPATEDAQSRARTGVPVVFLHGLRVSGSMWGPVARRVAAGRAVDVPDMPGHGGRRGEDFGVDAAVDAVTAAIDRVGGRAVLVGVSLGGYLAIATAARHPERVAGVVAMGCTTVPDRSSVLAYRALAAFIARGSGRGDRFSERAFRRMLPPDVAAAMVAGGIDGSVVPQVVQALAGFDVLGALRSYPGPVWLVNGEWDHFRRNEGAFLRACRQGRLAVWPRRHHLSCMADTDHLVRTVNDVCAVVDHAAEAD